MLDCGRYSRVLVDGRIGRFVGVVCFAILGFELKRNARIFYGEV